MKIEVCNLGAIKKADIELKPLTVFIGANSTGKTWLAYSSAAFLDSYGWQQYRKIQASDQSFEEFQPIKDLVKEILEQGNAKIDLVEFASQYGEEYFNRVFAQASANAASILGTKKASFENLHISVDINDVKPEFLGRIRAYSLQHTLATNRATKKSLLTASKEKNDSILYFYTEDVDALDNSLSSKIVSNFILSRLFEVIHRSLYSNVYILPTERTQLIAASFEEAGSNKSLARNRNLKKDNDEEGSIQVPFHVMSFLSMLSNSIDMTEGKRKNNAIKEPRIKAYLELADILEKYIIGGNIQLGKEENSKIQNFYFNQANGIVLEMQATSSMVKELTPLILYLRYVALPGQLLVIDEPEMNLHPEAQVRIIELLAMLVNYDLNVLITTHSPYIVDHLTNLMKAAQSEQKSGLADKFLLKNEKAFISRDKVSIRLFEDGTTKDILEENGLIDWGTFGRISDWINEVYFQID